MKVDLSKWDLSWGGAICCFAYITYAMNISSCSKKWFSFENHQGFVSFIEKCWSKSVTQRPIILKLIFEVLVHTYRLASILILFPLNFTTKLYNLSETFAINASY